MWSRMLSYWRCWFDSAQAALDEQSRRVDAEHRLQASNNLNHALTAKIGDISERLAEAQAEVRQLTARLEVMQVQLDGAVTYNQYWESRYEAQARIEAMKGQPIDGKLRNRLDDLASGALGE